MIRYHSPSDPNTYISYVGSYDVNVGGNVYYGPFRPDGSTLNDSVVEIRDLDDSIKTSPSIFGENDVVHRELEADLRWDPLIQRLNQGQASVGFKAHKGTSGYTSTTYTAYLAAFKRDKRNVTRGTFEYKGFSSHKEILKVLSSGSAYTTYNGWIETDLIVSNPAISWTEASFEQTETTHYLQDPISSRYKPDGVSTLDWIKSLPVSDSLTDVKTVGGMRVSYRMSTTPLISPGAVLRTVDVLKRLETPFPEVESHGDIAIKAVESLDTNDLNMFEFAQGLKNPKQLIPKLKELKKLKTHAGNYLGMEYGILPTISDLQELHSIITQTKTKYVDKSGNRIVSAGSTGTLDGPHGAVTVTHRCKLCIRDTQSNPLESLANLGSLPTLSNMWDLVAYSFVIDWFINIGDMLEAIDQDFRTARLPILYSTVSTKSVIDYHIPSYLTDAGVTGNVRMNNYRRSTGSFAPRPTLSFEVSNELPSHWLEAGALIVTRTK